jgi:hypothetical protein
MGVASQRRGVADRGRELLEAERRRKGREAEAVPVGAGAARWDPRLEMAAVGEHRRWAWLEEGNKEAVGAGQGRAEPPGKARRAHAMRSFVAAPGFAAMSGGLPGRGSAGA